MKSTLAGMLMSLLLITLVMTPTVAKSGDEAYPNAPAKEVDGLNRSIQVLQEETKRARTRDESYGKRMKDLEDRITFLESLPTTKRELDAWKAAHPRPPEAPPAAAPDRPEFAPFR